MREENGFDEPPMSWKRLTERVDQQDWPAGALYVIATPIGNLADLSLRAVEALRRCDVIAAEDTRSSRQLLDAWGVSTPMMAAHRHNEASAAQVIIGRLQKGERVALISDAGTPAVSDPGARVVRTIVAEGYRAIPVPGASAVMAALMVSGATTDENPAYTFAGFTPHKTTARQKWFRRWSAINMPVVFFESPHRLAASMGDLADVLPGDRLVTIARELTKRFEQVVTLPLNEVQAWLQQDPHHSQGEFVLVLHPSPDAADEAPPAYVSILLDALLEDLSVKDAARIAARATNLPKADLYRMALERGKNEL
ncbi:16S rRNA (cytidine(1402)-2'-O)-methyltransferase [Neopusillimonas maritima]|uniref:Ribosomal RNA small subunit methyltransferase I n=1 Tax=Neopusillimonas maritima TaxID=2026239 RepID=A0ABX9MZZ9_9BURK|nr:16S rRNA (cytidine(1402)-2'-O)-methyltransferase [Neopusillimonas maritima]RII84535.1 16S rRNA (cytidine(1402)-2'-O)-methyltransferase [Neopusillimonas maritima]